MSMGKKTLPDFIDRERKRFDGEYDNKFNHAFIEVYRYYRFLRIINDKHQSLISERIIADMNFRNAQPKDLGTYKMTATQMELWNKLTELSDYMQLEVESFYQFAKIFLDKMAYAIEYYFGKGPGKGFSHHSMVQKFQNGNVLKIENYCQIKGIELSHRLLNRMVDLQDVISDFRDNHITHLLSTRIFRGTGIDGRMSLGKIYPKDEKDNIWISSENLESVLESIDDYISQVVDFIETNADKTALPLKANLIQ